MYLHDPFLNVGSSLFVSVNSTNQHVATASMDGNISIRCLEKIAAVYKNLKSPVPEANGTNISQNGNNTNVKEQTSVSSVDMIQNNNSNATVNPDESNDSKKTQPIFEVAKTPELDPSLIASGQEILNIVGVRSRSKITSLKFANLTNNSTLLAAIYKNGEVYMITNPQDAKKCRIQQIFKHVNGLLLDFSWSADDQLLAFISMNNEIIIYDVIYGRILANLHLHENTEVINSKDGSTEELSLPVKGVTFDKTRGDLLFTLGDDKVLSVVKYQLVHDQYVGRKIEYTIIQEIDGIVNSAKLNKATIRKISISPDDNLISCPNTSKSKAMRISLLKRGKTDGDWKLSTELIANGFKCFMTIFSPCIYKNNRGETFYVLASLSTDSTLSIWRTDIYQPVYVVQLPPVLDFCWSADGSMIFLTPQNGSMIVAVFKKDEFGSPLDPNNDLTKFVHTKMRDNLPQEFERMTQWRKYINDYPETFKAKELEIMQTLAKQGKGKTTKPKASPKPVSDSKPIQQLITDTTGKKNSKEETTSKSIENNKPEIKGKQNDSTPFSTVKTTKKDESPKEQDTNNKPQPNTSASTKNKKDKENESKKETENSKKRPLMSSNYDLPSTSVPKDLNSKVVKMMKRDNTQSANGPNNGTTGTTNKKKRDAEPVDFVGAVVINPQISFSNIRIACPRLKTNISYRLPDDRSLHLTVKNGNGFESQPTRISVSKEITKMDSKPIFVDFVPQKIHLVCGSSKFWALSTSTGQILTYTESGRRVLPAIVLGSPLSFLEMKENFLLAVTSTGELFVWDLLEKKSLFKPVSLYPLLQPIYSTGQATSANTAAISTTSENESANVSVNVETNGLVFVNGEILTRSENLTICSITSQGIPIVTLSNGNGYLFNKDMNTWSLISDSWWAFGSQYWDSSMSIDNLKSLGLLEYMESHTNEEINRRGKTKFFSKISKMMLMKEGYENLETTISLNHLENKINFYFYLNDYNNYKTFLIMYAKRLSELNLKNRLLEVLQSLFIDKEGEICGHPKKKLLEELLLSCSKHREVQHILIQYSESIGLLPQADTADFDVL